MENTDIIHEVDDSEFAFVRLGFVADNNVTIGSSALSLSIYSPHPKLASLQTRLRTGKMGSNRAEAGAAVPS